MTLDGNGGGDQPAIGSSDLETISLGTSHPYGIGQRDTPAKLAEVAVRHRVDLAHWTLARAEPKDVRRLAAALNIQYRQLPDGEFNHSTVITLLDRDGRIAAQTSSILRPDAAFQAKLSRLTAR